MTDYHPLAYYGGKQYLAGWIAGLLPWSKDSVYVEPFGGMGAVLLARAPVKLEILNDRNDRIINWWRMVRDCPEEFGYLVEHTPLSRTEYRWAVENVDNRELSDLRRALAFHICIDQNLAGVDGHLSIHHGWIRAFNPAVGSLARHNRADIRALAERLRTVQLENIDGVKLLERLAGLDYAVIYCDPPYPSTVTNYYRYGEVGIRELRGGLLEQAGAVAISGFGSEWDFLGWEKSSHHRLRRQIQGKGEGRVEMLWRNAKCVELAAVQKLL